MEILSGLALSFTVFRRQDSSIGFEAPVRVNMRTGGITNAVVTSSLLESVSIRIWEKSKTPPMLKEQNHP